MMTDKELLCSEYQPIISTAVSTDSIRSLDILGLDRTLRLRCFAAVEEAFSGSATHLAIEVIAADDVALATNIDLLASTGTIPVADLFPPRIMVDFAMPVVTRAYLGFRYVVADGVFAAGSITAGLTSGSPTSLHERPRYETNGF